MEGKISIFPETGSALNLTAWWEKFNTLSFALWRFYRLDFRHSLGPDMFAREREKECGRLIGYMLDNLCMPVSRDDNWSCCLMALKGKHVHTSYQNGELCWKGMNEGVAMENDSWVEVWNFPSIDLHWFWVMPLGDVWLWDSHCYSIDVFCSICLPFPNDNRSFQFYRLIIWRTISRTLRLITKTRWQLKQRPTKFMKPDWNITRWSLTKPIGWEAWSYIISIILI